MPVVGSVLTGYLLYRYFPNARGSGIPQTKTALFVGGGRITLRTVFGKFLCSSTSLASGIALGREGPSVHIGAGIASVLGRWLRLSPKKVESLLLVGAAAALAAAFNTPIAAILFALEEVMGDLHAPLIGSVVFCSATSWMVLHLVLGDEPLFHVPPYALVHPVEFVVLCGFGTDWRSRFYLVRKDDPLDAPAIPRDARNNEVDSTCGRRPAGGNSRVVCSSSIKCWIYVRWRRPEWTYGLPAYGTSS
jgi:H+/Cl- antiporter ClcA